MVLKIIGIAESTYYYQKQQVTAEIGKPSSGGRPISGYSMNQAAKPISDAQIKEWLIEMVLGEEHGYGYRKLTKSLRRQYNLNINKKKSTVYVKNWGF